jgi:hypothetical protein
MVDFIRVDGLGPPLLYGTPPSSLWRVALSSLFQTASELDFSHLRAKGVGYARHTTRPKEVIELRTLPTTMIRVLAPFAPLFSKRVWQNVQVLLAGAILAPGKRTVASALRAMGLDRQKRFHRYHRVLSRASWASLKASRVLVELLVEAFVPEGDPLVLGIDETLERRYGKKLGPRASTAIRSAPPIKTS